MYVQPCYMLGIINILIPTEYVHSTTLRFSRGSFSNSYTITITQSKYQCKDEGK